MRRIALALLAIIATAFAVSFLGFAITVFRAEPPAAAITADAVIVLTGGGGERIAAGMNLLSAGRAQRLLVSGVNPLTSRSDIRALAGGDDARFDCCVDLGRTAGDTVGNARETADWGREQGYGALFIVTSDYHMPRSLRLIAAAYPEGKLIPYPVRHRADMRQLAVEYLKYMVTLVRGPEAPDTSLSASSA